MNRTPVSGDDREIGARIRKARERLGVSVTDLGMAYGRNRQTVQFWEKGENFPPVGDFLRLCLLLRVNPNQLMGLEDMEPLSQQEAAKAQLEIQVAARVEKARREAVARVRPARRGLQRSTGQTGRFRRPV